MQSEFRSRTVLSWAFYDWANSAFATTVMAGFFPVFFKQYWASSLDYTDSTFYLGLTQSVGGLILALMAPFLGALADVGGYKKRLLFIFTLVGVVATCGLSFVAAGDWKMACLIYGIALFGFSVVQIPYDSLLVNVTKPDAYDEVSGFGYALGYLGGGLLFALNVAMTLKPHLFGLADPIEAVKISFFTVGVWWLVFSIPIFIGTREVARPLHETGFKFFVQCWRDVGRTVREILSHRVLAFFLLGYFFYIEGVNTTIKMAVDYGLSLGFQSKDMIVALLIVQFVAFPFALIFGWLGRVWGTKRSLILGLSVYVLMGFLAYRMTRVQDFYWMAVMIGTVQGGVQSLSRSYYAALVPEGKSAEFFGFFNMLGKFSSILGPICVGLAVESSGSSRATTVVLSLFFLIGMGFLILSRPPKRA